MDRDTEAGAQARARRKNQILGLGAFL